MTTGFSRQEFATKEYQIKAVFLYNFTQFVEWPGNSFAEKNSPLIIGVLGENPFGSYLQETVFDEKANEHPIEVHHYNEVGELQKCHILFVNKSKKVSLEPIFEKLKIQNVLTVGDSPDFIQQSGMVRFFLSNDKTQIQVNLQAAKDAELKISSKLLSIVEIVTKKRTDSL